MYRYLFRFSVTTLTILTANLLTTAISNYMTGNKSSFRPLTFTLTGMAVIVVVFYPLFMKMEIWVSGFSAKVIRSGKSLAGKYLGLLLAFTSAIVVLLYFYAKMWYNVNIFSLLLQGNIGRYL